MRARPAASVIIAVAIAAACGEPAGPDDLIVDLDVVPERVAPGNSLTARATVTNPTTETIRATAPLCGGLWVQRAVHGGESVELDGLIANPWGVSCLAAVATPALELEPGSSTIYHRPIRASVDGEPVAPGDYRLEFEPVVDGLAGAETTFTVE